MKILQVNKLYFPTVGGIERVVKDISDGLNGKEGIEVEVLVCNDKNKNELDVVNGVKIHRAGAIMTLFRMPISFSFFGLFRKLSRESDICILHHPFPLSFLAYKLFGRSKKLVIWYHSDIVKQKVLGFFVGPLIKSILRRADLIFVSNNNLIKNSTNLISVKDKCKVLPYGVDLSEFVVTDEVKAQSQEIAKKYGDKIILSVGRLVYYKGFEYLIKAFEGVGEANLLIIGSGPLRDELSGIIRNHGLADKVFIIDHVPDLRPYYNACRFFVLPSVANSEAFGLVQIEAMAYGKPVINTNLPTGVPEVSLNGETGITVAPRSETELTEAMKKLLSDNDLYNIFVANSLKRIKNVFSMEVFLDKTINYLKKIILR